MTSLFLSSSVACPPRLVLIYVAYFLLATSKRKVNVAIEVGHAGHVAFSKSRKSQTVRMKLIYRVNQGSLFCIFIRNPSLTHLSQFGPAHPIQAESKVMKSFVTFCLLHLLQCPSFAATVRFWGDNDKTCILQKYVNQTLFIST